MLKVKSLVIQLATLGFYRQPHLVLQFAVRRNGDFHCSCPTHSPKRLSGRGLGFWLVDLQINTTYIRVAGLAKADLEGFGVGAGARARAGRCVRIGFGQHETPRADLALQCILPEYGGGSQLSEVDQESRRDGQQTASKNQITRGDADWHLGR